MLQDDIRVQCISMQSHVSIRHRFIFHYAHAPPQWNVFHYYRSTLLVLPSTVFSPNIWAVEASRGSYNTPASSVSSIIQANRVDNISERLERCRALECSKGGNARYAPPFWVAYCRCLQILVLVTSYCLPQTEPRELRRKEFQ